MDKAERATELIESDSLYTDLTNFRDAIHDTETEIFIRVQKAKELGLGHNLIAQAEIPKVKHRLEELQSYVTRCINAIEETQETVGTGSQTSQGTTEEQQEGKGS